MTIVIHNDSKKLFDARCKAYVKSLIKSKNIKYVYVSESIPLPDKYGYVIYLNKDFSGVRCTIYKRLENGNSKFIGEKIIYEK